MTVLPGAASHIAQGHSTRDYLLSPLRPGELVEGPSLDIALRQDRLSQYL